MGTGVNTIFPKGIQVGGSMALSFKCCYHPIVVPQIVCAAAVGTVLFSDSIKTGTAGMTLDIVHRSIAVVLNTHGAAQLHTE